MIQLNKRIVYLALFIIILIPSLMEQAITSGSKSQFKEQALEDAWASYQMACSNQKPKGYIVLGKYDSTTDKIENKVTEAISKDESLKANPIAIKFAKSIDIHEQCHQSQARENRFATSCRQVIKKLNNEFECSIKQYEFLAGN